MVISQRRFHSPSYAAAAMAAGITFLAPFPPSGAARVDDLNDFPDLLAHASLVTPAFADGPSHSPPSPKKQVGKKQKKRAWIVDPNRQKSLADVLFCEGGSCLEDMVDYYTLTPWRFQGIKPPAHFKDTPKNEGLAHEEVTFQSYLPHDGKPVNLRGWYINGSMPNDNVVVLCHANHGSKSDLIKYAKFLHNHGHNVFMFDFRGQGESDGLYVTYGVHEKEDLRAAIDYLKAKQGAKKIAVYGQRLGAATAFMEDAAHHNIDVIVADSSWAEVTNVAAGYARRLNYDIPTALIPSLVEILHALSNARTGADYTQLDIRQHASRLDRTPVLLIHDTNDPLYPHQNSVVLYGALGEPKELLSVDRVRNLLVPTRVVQERVLAFLGQHF